MTAKQVHFNCTFHRFDSLLTSLIDAETKCPGSISNSGTLMTGFITDTHGEFYTVFVPTGPNPTSGNIYHVHQSKLTRTNTPVDTGMKTIISCGAGSNEIFNDRIIKESS